MKGWDEEKLMFAIVVLFSNLICFSIGYITGEGDMECQAIRRGYAEVVPVGPIDGITEFRWKKGGTK